MSLADARGCKLTTARMSRLPPDCPTTNRERVERRYLYWLGLRRAGAKLQDIADDSGFSVATVFYGLQKAERIAAERLRRRSSSDGDDD